MPKYLYRPYQTRLANPMRPVHRTQLDELHHPNETPGSLMYYRAGVGYVTIPPGDANQVLVVVNGNPVWADLSSIVDYNEAGDLSTIDIGDAAAAGTSLEIARADHQHAFTAPSAGYPQDVASAEADGSATTPARSDHVHAHEAAHMLHDTGWAAKGDLAVGTADNTAQIVTVGTNGYLLTADSTQATGMKWAEAPASGITAFPGYIPFGTGPAVSP